MLSYRNTSFTMILLFNVTVTTSIYTYLHTLALHDALPTCPDRPHPARDLPLPDRLRAEPPCARAVGHRPERRVRHAAADRSEEHTSELQSLMRISYAVFCLKKK